MLQPKTGQKCYCKRGIQRDNCPNCEGTGWVVDFRAIREKIKTDQNKKGGDVMKKYRVWAGEGERGTIGGYATTLRGAKRIATRESCDGDRWTRIEINLEGTKNSLGEELTGWANIEE